MKQCMHCGGSYLTSKSIGLECPDCYRAKQANKKADFAASQQRKQESWEADLAGMESTAKHLAGVDASRREAKQEHTNRAHAAEGARLAGLMAGAMTSTLPTLKACPDCGEDVKFIARKCKHCSFVFENAQAEVEAAQEEADKAKAEATANAIRQMGEESSSALGFAMRVAVAQLPDPAGTDGFAYCAMFAKREFRLDQRQMAGKAMFDDAIRTRWNKQDNESKGSVEQLLNAATVVVKAKIQVGDEPRPHLPGNGFNLGLRMEPKPLGLLVRSGVSDSDGVLSIGQGFSAFDLVTLQHIVGKEGATDEWSEATQRPNIWDAYVFNCPETVRTRTGSTTSIFVDRESPAERKSAGEPLDIQFEFLIEPGALKVTPGLMAGGEAWASAEPFVLSSNDVLVLELAWQIKAGGFLSAEQVTGYKIINATKYSSNRSNHMGRWGNRLEHALSESASLFHHDANFEERDKQLQMLECLDLLWNDEFPEEALGEGEVILGGSAQEEAPEAGKQGGPTSADAQESKPETNPGPGLNQPATDATVVPEPSTAPFPSGWCKSRSVKVISGVCGGIAQKTEIPVQVIRLGFFFFNCLGVLAYVVLSATMPVEPES